MPTLKVKTIYIDKLKQLGVYDKWLDNVKAGDWNYYTVKMKYATDFDNFVHVSFLWTDSLEGYDYWCSVSRH